MWTMLGWFLFILFVIGALYFDLSVLRKRGYEVPIRIALKMAGFWMSLAFIFGIGIFVFDGHEKALLYLTGYLIEESLSVDNLFVFLLIFSYFRIPAAYQSKALFCGILGAIVMRLTFILAGIALIKTFHWMLYVFGIFLIFTGIKLALQGETEIHPERNPVLRLFKKFIPVEHGFHGGRFFIKMGGITHSTPLFVAVLMIAMMDVVFAVDSIPAIMAITLDPFIIYTSNVFAILGLRSIFFALSGLMQMFHYLNYGLSFILVFLGIKMTVAEFFKIPVYYSLGFIAFTLAICVGLSLMYPKEDRKIPEEIEARK